MDWILESNALTRRFGAKVAVNQVSIHLQKGEIYGLIGRNGAGKTTFLKMIAGQLQPTAGSFSLFGRSQEELDREHLRRKLGVLIEAPGIHGSMSAADNLKLKCLAAGIPPEQTYIDGLLTLVGLQLTGKMAARKFSLGMKQRLGIALAMVGDPELLILDEPTNGLDPEGIAQMRELFVRLTQERNMTIIISSHILEELAKIATHFGILENGVLLREFTPGDAVQQNNGRVIIRMAEPFKAAPVLESLGIRNYRFENADTVHIFEKTEDTFALMRAFVQADVPISTLNYESSGIEEFYLTALGGQNNG